MTCPPVHPHFEKCSSLQWRRSSDPLVPIVEPQLLYRDVPENMVMHTRGSVFTLAFPTGRTSVYCLGITPYVSDRAQHAVATDPDPKALSPALSEYH